MTVRRPPFQALEKVWGTPDTEPWFPRSEGKTGEVWFTAPEEPRLLLKFLFTSEKLSVQVHPGDTAAGPGKTEMWHVLRAAPNAAVALGFERPLAAAEARAAALSGEIEHLLRWVPAHPGDTFFVPAGTVHAIGAGLVLCEIQQHSDVTYRLYDYGRPRELHLDAALAVAHLDRHPGANPPEGLGDGRRLLAQCPYFRTESVEVRGRIDWHVSRQAEFLVWLEGRGQIGNEPCGPGEVWLLADCPSVPIEARNARLLRVFVPETV